MSRPAGSGRSLPPVVKQLGVVSFFNDLASEMVYPLLPALVTLRLGGTAVALGALDGVAEAVAAAVKAGAGWLADRPGWRRPLMVGGYAIAAVVRPAMGVAVAAWQVVGLRGVDRLGKGVRNPPRDAVIADASPRVIRGRAFGFHRAMDHAGAVIGPLIAWVLLAAAGATPSEVILASLFPGMIAVVVVSWAMQRVENGKWKTTERAQVDAVALSPRHEASSPSPRSLWVLIVAFAFARFPEALLLLRIQELGVAVATVPLLWAALHVVRTAASYPGGWLSDTIGPRRTMLLGWGIYAVFCIGLAFADGAGSAAAWLLIFGLVAAGTESPERAFIAAAARLGRRGRGYGVYYAAVGFAALPGGLVLGAVYHILGAQVALVLSGGVVALLVLLGGVTPDWRR